MILLSLPAGELKCLFVNLVTMFESSIFGPDLAESDLEEKGQQITDQYKKRKKTEEGWRVQWLKWCHNKNKDEDISVTVNNNDFFSQKFRQKNNKLMHVLTSYICLYEHFIWFCILCLSIINWSLQEIVIVRTKSKT